MIDAFHNTINKLADSGIDSPRLEARMLIAHILGVDINNLPADITLSAKQQSELMLLVERRIAHEPLDKILGYKEFYKYTFKVSKDVLSPRPDSEILVEEAIRIAKMTSADSILEFGIGSGCLILSILADCQNLRGLGLDKSPAALKIANENAAMLGVSNRVEFREFDYFKDRLTSSFPLIISNPPYIPTAEISQLDTEVKAHDPFMALDGGNDGYDHYRQLAQIIPNILLPQGFVLLEGGAGQADTIASLFVNQGLHLIKKARDLSGVERCIILQK